MKYKLLILIMGMILLVLISGCDSPDQTPNWTIEGEAIFAENDYGKITVTPHTINNYRKIQEMEICSKINQNIKLNWSFIFDERISNAGIKLLTNKSYSVTDYGTCEGSYDKLVCEDEPVNSSCDDETFYYDYSCPIGSHIEYRMEYVDRSNLFNYKKIGDKHYYYILNVDFKPLECKQIKYNYDTSLFKTGKYEVYIQSGIYDVLLDPWYGSNNFTEPFDDRVYINETLTTMLNFTGRFTLNATGLRTGANAAVKEFDNFSIVEGSFACSDESGGHECSLLYDATYSGTTYLWYSNVVTPPWVKFDLGQERDICGVQISLYQSWKYSPEAGFIEGSLDNVTWYNLTGLESTPTDVVGACADAVSIVPHVWNLTILNNNMSRPMTARYIKWVVSDQCDTQTLVNHFRVIPCTYDMNGTIYSQDINTSQDIASVNLTELDVTTPSGTTANVSVTLNWKDWFDITGSLFIAFPLGTRDFGWKFNATTNNENVTPTITTLGLWLNNESADTTPPYWNNNGTNNTAPTTGDNVSFYVNWTDETALSYYIFSWSDNSDWLNDTNGSLSGTSVNLTINKSITARQGGEVCWKMFVNDSSNNWNETDEWCFDVVDTGSPIWNNNGTNNTSPQLTEVVKFYINWSDNVNLSHYIFSWNDTGTWVNDSSITFDLTEENDTESQYSCEGTFNVAYPCAGAVDEDWNQIARCDAASAVNCSVWENYTIPNYTDTAIWNIYYQGTGGFTNDTILCYDYNDEWYIFYNDTELPPTLKYLNISIPSRCLRGSKLQIWTRVPFEKEQNVFTTYIEGQVIWHTVYNSLNITRNKTITSIGGKDVYWKWYANDTTGNKNVTDEWFFTVADLIPPAITDICLTSPDPDDCTSPYTTADATPTFNFTTDETAFCRISNANSTWQDFTTTDGTYHIGTIPVNKTLSAGTNGVYLNCTDNSSNSAYKNLTTIIADTKPPYFSNYITNATSTEPTKDSTIALTVNVSENIDGGLSNINIAHNATGTMTNQTFYVINGVTEINFTYNLSITWDRGNITYQWWANDTFGNDNVSELQYFLIRNSPPTTPTLLYPTDGLEIKITNISLNITASTDADGDTITYYYFINGSLNSTAGGNSTFNASVNGNHSLEVSAFDGIAYSANTSIIHFTIDTIPLSVISNLMSNTSIFYTNLSFQINYSDNIELDKLNISINNQRINTTEGLGGATYSYTDGYSISNLTVGKHNLSTTICDVALNCNTFAWYFYKFNYSVSYPDELIEGSYAPFKLTISTPDGFPDTNISANFNYNHTWYSTTKTTSAIETNFTVTVTTPTLTIRDTNITFFWNYSVNNINHNTSDINHTVKLVGLDNCILYSTHAMNFTIRDEINTSKVKTEIEAIFSYSIERVIFKTFTLSLTDASNFSICITPFNETLFTNYSVSYGGDEMYPERRVVEDAEFISSATLNKSLYLLSVGEGIYIRFNVVTAFNEPINNVEVVMKKIISGVEQIIQQEYTDGSGLATIWVDPDEEYVFSFTKTGYRTFTKTLRPSSSEIYTITLEAESTAEAESYETGVSYTFSPSGIQLQNDTYYNFSFNMNSSFWDITNCTLFLKNGSTILSQSTNDFSIRSCSITINFNTGNYTSITSEAIYELNNTANLTVSTQYSVRHTYVGEFSLKNFFDDIKAFSSAGFDDFTRMILAFIVIFAIVGTASYKFEALREPESLIILTWVLILIFSYLGFFTLNYDAIPSAWLKQYVIFILVSLGAAAYIIKRVSQ